MSRIGKRPVPIPAGVDVVIEGNTVTVKGPKGQLKRSFHPAMRIEIVNGHIQVSRPSDEKEHRALHGLTRTLVHNMIEGVTKGYQKGLEIRGVGYRATKQGNKVVLSVGFSHPVEFTPAAGIELEVPAPTRITVRGIDKELVGETAAQIRRIKPPEPYGGKGIMYEGEQIRRKAGKAGKVSR